MGAYNMRFGSQLSFDEQQEADIIKTIEKLNSSHKTGRFISNLIRIAFDCPDLLNNKNGTIEYGTALKMIDEMGISTQRKNFIDTLTKEVNEMKQKVDSMYEMTLRMYILAQTGNRLGLKEKANNQLMAQFVIEKQLKELQDLLGVALYGSTFKSNKQENVEKIAEDALEYIIESYSGVYNELKELVQPAQVVVTQQVASEDVTAANTNNQAKVNEVVESSQNNNLDIKNNEEDDDNDEDEIIDFGNADIAMLNNFFGGSFS